MMSTRAPACPPPASSATANQASGPAGLSVRRRRGGARALLAALFLLPLAACAMQPATGSTAAQATPAAVEPATQAPATRQQAGAGSTAGRQESGAAAQAPAAAAGATRQDTAAPPPVAERATTVGEAPAVAGAPAAPSPGTPANPGMLPHAAAPGPSTGTLLQTIFALVLVLALLAALAWAAKRYGPRVTSSTANLRMVGALNIGGRERIMVVEVGDQWIVVGASPGRVNALATMPKGDAAAGAALAGHTPSASNFSDWLKQTIDKRNAK